METKGFNGNISQQNKEALQSETWQSARKAMKLEVQHFTETPEIQDFSTEKAGQSDNVYGSVWGNVVREYLKTAYAEGNSDVDVVSEGVAYKVLKREEVTAFYDADGNTLFDVENKRLEKEYGYVMQEGNMDAGSEEENDNATKAEKENADLEKKEAGKETGEAQEEKPEGKTENDAPADNVIPLDPDAIKQKAKEKLEKEMADDKEDKNFAELVIGYLLERCEDDLGLAQDVVQEHKTWEKCLDYIYKLAKKQATGMRAVIRNDVVYEWAEDYYHKDDKAEEEKKAKEAAERKKKQEERMKKAKSKPDKSEPQKPKEEPKPKKNSKEVEGQMDMFSMMGM